MTPSTTSAATFSIVCETIVPMTTGVVSRGRPARRATISARAGSPRRAGSVADISTPIAVPWKASMRVTGRSGSPARRIACHAIARSTIEAHMTASAASTHGGLERRRLVGDPVDPDALERDRGQARGRRRRRRRARRGGRRCAASRARRPPSGAGSSVAMRRGGTAGRPSAGEIASRRARRARGRRGRAVQRAGAGLDRLLVDAEDLGGDLRPGVAARVLGRRGAHRGEALGRRAPARAASRRARSRRRAGRGCRRGRRGRRRGSRRCRSRRPACPARTPRSGPCRSSRRRATARRARRPRAARGTSPRRRRGPGP